MDPPSLSVFVILINWNFQIVRSIPSSKSLIFRLSLVVVFCKTTLSFSRLDIRSFRRPRESRCVESLTWPSLICERRSRKYSVYTVKTSVIDGFKPCTVSCEGRVDNITRAYISGTSDLVPYKCNSYSWKGSHSWDGCVVDCRSKQNDFEKFLKQGIYKIAHPRKSETEYTYKI